MKLRKLIHSISTASSGAKSGVAKSDGLQRVCERVREGISLSVLKKDKVEIMNRPAKNYAGRFFIGKNVKDALKAVNPHELSIEVINIQGKDRVWIKGQPKLQSGLNKIIREVPAVMDNFKHADAYLPDGLDKHVLSGWKKAMEMPAYKKLSKRKKRIVDLAILLHDRGKIGKLPKTEHATDSAKMAVVTLKDVKMLQRDKELVVKLIEHHHYTENIAKGKKTAEEYSEIFNNNHKEIELIEIISNADVASKKDEKKVAKRLAENVGIFAKQREALGKVSVMDRFRTEFLFPAKLKSN